MNTLTEQDRLRLAVSSTAPVPAVPEPLYAALVFEMLVDRAADAVWARVGKFCDIAEWGHYHCTLISGVDGQLGAVRLVSNGVHRITEMMVGRTDLSYTYTQPVIAGVPFNAYHGTLEAKSIRGAGTKLTYSFFYDTSMMKGDAARAAEVTERRSRVMRYLANMKILAEGGTL
jgi:hypothetical protein